MGDSPIHRMAVRVLLALGLAGCTGVGGGSPVSPEAFAARTDELLAPFTDERQIVADRLEVVLTRNFFEDLVLSATSPRVQSLERRTEANGDDVYDYRTSHAVPLRFQIGSTGFLILERARIVVLAGRQDLTLRADASGRVSVLQGGERRDVGSVQIAEGAFTGR